MSKHLRITLFITLFSLSYGLDFKFDNYTFMHADSTTFTGKYWGDEYWRNFETSTGYRIILDSNEYWNYAEIGSNGFYSPSGKIVGTHSPSGINTHLELPDSSKVKLIEDYLDVMEENERSVDCSQIYLKLFFVEFTNVTHDEDANSGLGFLATDFENLFFSEDYYNVDNSVYSPTGATVFGSISDYYKEMSDNECDFTGEILNNIDVNGVPVWENLNNTKHYYHINPFSVIWSDIEDNFSETYDLTVDTDEILVIIYAGNTYFTLPGSQLSGLHPQAIGEIKFIMSEKFDRPFGQENALDDFSPIGPFCHEMGHLILSLLDYHSSGNFSDFNNYYWSLMSHGSYNGPNNLGNCPPPFLPYYRIQAGWLTETTIGENESDYSFAYSYPNSNVYKLGSNQDDYFLIENRQLTGFNQYLPGWDETENGGLLIWHIYQPLLEALSYDLFVSDLVEADGLQEEINLINDIFPGPLEVNDIHDCIDVGFSYIEWDWFASPSEYEESPSRLAVFDMSSSANTITADVYVEYAGDVNEDRATDILDLIRTISFWLDINTPTDMEECIADISFDDIIDVLDVILIAEVILGESIENYPTGELAITNIFNEESLYIDVLIAANTKIEGAQFEIDFDDFGYKVSNIDNCDYSGDFTIASKYSPDSTLVKWMVYSSIRSYIDFDQYGTLARIHLEEIGTISSLDSTVYTEKSFVNLGNGGQYLNYSYKDFDDFQSFVCDMDSTLCYGCTDSLALNFEMLPIYDDTSCVFLLGDMNADESLSVSDIVIMNAIILETITPTAYQEFAGDMDGDGDIDVADVVILLDIIMSQRSMDRDGGEGEILISKEVNPYGIHDGEDASLTITLYNEPIVRAMLVTVDLEENYLVSSINLGERASSMDIQHRIFDDSTKLSFILYSTNGYDIEAGLGSILEVGLKSISLGRHSNPDDGEFGNIQIVNLEAELQEYEIVVSEAMEKILENGFNPSEFPTSFVLYPAYPNPFNPITTLKYYIPENAHVIINLYDLQGKKCLNVLTSDLTPGNYSNAVDCSELSTGIYFLKMQAINKVSNKVIVKNQKIVVLK